MTTSELLLAKQRIAARHADNDLNEISVFRSRASNISKWHTFLPGSLYPLLETLSSGWKRISRREGSRPSFRVGQVDSELLDEELLDLLKTQIADGLKNLGSHLQDDWAAEISLGLRALLFKLTIWDHNATYGATLQNLQYSDARFKGEGFIPASNWQKISFGILTIGARYMWTKWEDWTLNKYRGSGVSYTVKLFSSLHGFLGTIHDMASLVNFLMFLVNGKYRTLVDRILRLRLVPRNNRISREVSFEYLNRQLVWHAITEFLLFILPLVGINRWRRWLARVWKKTKYSVMNGVQATEDSSTGELAFLPERTCALCYQTQTLSPTSEAEVIASTSGITGSALNDITNPYESIPCGCIYCYSCLAGQLELEEGEGWNCLRCGKEIKECIPWNGDVITEPDKLVISSKTVLFSKSDCEMSNELEPYLDKVEVEENQEDEIESNDSEH